MWIRAISVEGFAGLPRLEARGLGRVVRVGGPARAQGALFDALSLALAAFAAEEARAAMARVAGGARVKVEGAPRPDTLEIERPERLVALLDPAADRKLRVQLEIELDPPQFGLMREHALRSPELARALGEQAATLTLGVGLAFTRDLSVASVAVFGERLGEVAPPPGQPTPWRDTLLATLAGRARARGPLELDLQAVVAADRSPHPPRRAALARMRAALQAPPFGLPRLELVEGADGEPWAALGPDLQPLTALGPAAVEAVGLAEAVFVDPAELLLLRAPGALCVDPGAVLAWLVGQVEAEGSPLEQLWLFDLAGPPDLALDPPDAAPPRPGLRFPSAPGARGGAPE